jgi:hypothetical protein
MAMKSLYRKLGLLSVVLMGLSFSACDDAKYKPVDTGLYLAETSTKSLVGKKIISADDGHYFQGKRAALTDGSNATLTCIRYSYFFIYQTVLATSPQFSLFPHNSHPFESAANPQIAHCHR